MKYPNVDFNKDIFISFLKKDLERLSISVEVVIENSKLGEAKSLWFFPADVYRDLVDIYDKFSNTYLSFLYAMQGLDIISASPNLKNIRSKFRNKMDRFVTFKLSCLSWSSYSDHLTLEDREWYLELCNTGIKNLITANKKLEKIKEELSDLERNWKLSQLIAFHKLLSNLDVFLCNSALKLENPEEKIKKLKEKQGNNKE